MFWEYQLIHHRRHTEMFLPPQGPAVLWYQVEEFHFLSLWPGSWPRGTISLLAPGGLSMQPLGDTTCSTTALDGASVGLVEGCVFVKLCLWCKKEIVISFLRPEIEL